jgi:hypothetical protein
MSPEFKPISFPQIKVEGMVPQDLKILAPKQSQLPISEQHFLLYIPWEKKYQQNIPPDFSSLFNYVLPYLHVRTTDVHTAICLGFLDEALRQHQSSSPNRRVIGASLILHDCGWSQLSEAEITQSLGVAGLALSQDAIKPKEKHAIEGEQLAKNLLSSFDFNPPLLSTEINTILQAVRFHDQPELVAGMGKNVPIEVQLLVDLDHLWSFTKENFWQDTLRKGVSPQQYAANLQHDLPTYFVTDWGKSTANQLLIERQQEIAAIEKEL